MAYSITCPSGLHFSVRKYKGREANLFTNKKLVREGGLISSILNAIVLEVDDPGPYPIEGKIIPWDGALSGDRMIALIDSRVATYTPELSFPIQCESQQCRETWTEDIDLTKDLKRKVLSPSSLASFQNGNRFSTSVRDDQGQEREVKFHLLTGVDEKALIKVSKRNKDEQVTASLAQRLNEIDGVHRNDLTRFVRDLDLDEINALVERMDDEDCGVDTTMQVECPECGHRQEYEVPLGGKEFFLPKRRQTSPTHEADS